MCRQFEYQRGVMEERQGSLSIGVEELQLWIDYLKV